MSASALLGFVLIIATSTFVLAEKGDNTAPASVGEKHAVITTSYFQGTWEGTWTWGGGNKGSDLSIKIGPKNPDGTFDVEYYSGPYSGPYSSGLAYTVNIKGQEVGDTFEFKVQSPKADFGTRTITMTKLEGGRAKAKTQGKNSALEAVLTRN
jgi:hypothetical protein